SSALDGPIARTAGVCPATMSLLLWHAATGTSTRSHQLLVAIAALRDVPWPDERQIWLWGDREDAHAAIVGDRDIAGARILIVLCRVVVAEAAQHPVFHAELDDILIQLAGVGVGGPIGSRRGAAQDRRVAVVLENELAPDVRGCGVDKKIGGPDGAADRLLQP